MELKELVLKLIVSGGRGSLETVFMLVVSDFWIEDSTINLSSETSDRPTQF